ncbi:MAG: class I SAM-dependent methyltransferase [Planctomycetes bacterium]|nr:class I SAM-dependent methyltransferase [Planctomycetota bacterium]
MPIHETAAKGFQSAAGLYDRGRPDYPLEGVECLLRELRLDPSRTVIDLGAGTGKFTRLLIASGATIIAVEPVEEMRRQFAASLPGIRLVDGAAEATTLPSSAADAVVAAQAFHWFATGAALAEIHRVLKPGGRLGLIWNTWDPAVEWVVRLREILDDYAGATPRYKSGQWRLPFRETALFTPLEERHFPHLQRGPLQTVLDRVASISFVALLPGERRVEVLRRVRELAETHPVTRGQAEIGMPYVTDVYWAARK